MNAELNILIQKDPESGWFVGQIEEFPAAISQGETIDDVKANLLDALDLLLETQREELNNYYESQNVIKDKLIVA
jgi:predicted RNase H-like HicB family nuclease